MSSSKQNNPLIELFVPALFHRGWKKKTFWVNPCSASISLVSEIKIKPVNTPYFLDKYHVFQNLTHDEKLILHLLLNVKAVILISMNNVFELWSHHRACLQIVTSFAIFFFCCTGTIKELKAFTEQQYWICKRELGGNWRCSTDPNYHWLLQCVEFVYSVGSNKVLGLTALMGTGLHSCVLFDLISGVFEIFSCKLVGWQLFLVSPHIRFVHSL